MIERVELNGSGRLPPATTLSAASGLAWALIAWLVGYRAFGHQIWGGIVIAPLIGILIARLSSPLREKPRWVQIVGSLFFLYVAASCFALGMAILSPVHAPRGVRMSALLMQSVLAVLWGLTFGGYALVLWPLSYLNHRLVWQGGAGQLPVAPELRTSSAAIRTLAVRIMAVAVAAYVAWALLQTARLSSSPMPWWVVTDLMSWSRWLVLGIIVWLSAPLLAFGATFAADSEERSTSTYRQLAGVVGFAVFLYPGLSFAADLIVIVIKVSLVQSWATEGTVLWAPYYYRNVFRMCVPWFVVGAALMGMARAVRRSRT